MSATIIAPSVLSADFTDLKTGIKTIERSGADWIHLDVMDGHFVPPITFGPQMVSAIRQRTAMTLDTHLMVDSPASLIDDFIHAGTNYLTFHIEAVVHAHRLVQRIRDAGVHPGIAIVPSTPISAVKELLTMVDLFLIMTVNPGYGGQTLIPSCLEKVAETFAFRRSGGNNFYIEVDGGINEDTAAAARKAGVDVLVTGSSFFSATDPDRYVSSLQGTASQSV